MNPILVDVGNSAIKWCELVDIRGGRLGEVQRCDASAEALPVALERAGLMGRDVHVSSVAGQIFDDELRAALAATADARVRMARATATACGLTNSYSEPEKMGVDRWLAMIAAKLGCDQPIIVVDAGTALTIDLVDADGRHTGGYIVPGITLMDQALTRETGRVRHEGRPEPSASPGRSTAECVNGGIWTAAIGSVQWVIDQHPDHQLVVTGGDGQALMALGLKGEWRPNLVLEGLMRVASAATDQ